jgi:hypothetical protein
MNKYLSVFLFFIITIFITSCSFIRLKRATGKGEKIVLAGTDSGKIATTLPPSVIPKPDTAVKTPDSTATLKQLIDRLSPIWNTRLDFKTYSAKTKMRFEGPDNKHELTAHIRVRKDSVIWIHVTAVMGGFPVARIFVTRDSFFMLNYLDKEVVAVPLSRAVRILPGNVDFASFQNLIMGEPLRNGAITDARKSGDSILIRVEDSSYVQFITYNRSDSTMRSAVLRTHNPSGPEASTQYSNYEITNNRRISTNRVLNIQNGNDNYLLEMNFNKSDFDEPLEYPFSIPRNYTVKQE